MSRKKAFFISMGLSLCVILPIFAVYALYCIVYSSPAQTNDIEIPIENPAPTDAKNILLITNSLDKPVFVLMRFDALQRKISVLDFNDDTIVLNGGSAITLQNALNSAGPALCAEAIAKTLNIRVDNYLWANADDIASLAAGFGTAKLTINQLITGKNTSLLKKFAFNGGSGTVGSVTAQTLLQECGLSGTQLSEFRGAIYAAFMQAAAQLMYKTVPDFMRSNKVKTNLDASAIYTYEKIFSYFMRDNPEVSFAPLAGSQTANGFELNEESLKQAVDMFT